MPMKYPSCKAECFNDELTKKLEFVAQKALGHHCQPYIEGYHCPWLSFQMINGLNTSRVKGVLLMQDWGEHTTLSEDISFLKQYPKRSMQQCGTRHETVEFDSTCNGLYCSLWRPLIWDKNPQWLVTNALWGKKPGKRPAEYHQRAFRVWFRLILALLKTNQRLDVVFAGEWARISSKCRNPMPLSLYLELWCKRTYDQPLEKLCGKACGLAYFVPHPSQWCCKSERVAALLQIAPPA